MRTANDSERAWDAAVALHESAREASERGELATAFARAQRAVSRLAAAVGRGHPDHANATLLLGRILIRMGRARRALPHLSRAAAQLARWRGGEPVVRELAVDARLAVASCTQELGELASARRHARRALAIAEAAFGARSLLAAQAHNQLGVIAKFRGRFVVAEAHYRRALPVYEKAFGARSAEVACVLHNLGGLAHARGRFAEGEPLARAAAVIARQRLRPSDPERIAHEVAHAALLDGLGHQRRSIPIYRRSITAFTRIYGPVHYEVASTLHNLAAAEHALGRAAVAERHYREAAGLLARVRGAGDPDLALARYNLGVLLRETGRSRAARGLVRQARAAFVRRLGARHPSARACGALLVALDRES